MDPFSISSNARISVPQSQPQQGQVSVARPSQTITIAQPQQQPRLSVVNSPYAQAPAAPQQSGLSIAQPNFGSFNFPQLDYERIDSFIADGTQTNPVTGQKYEIGTPVLEVPDWFASTPELQDIIPMIEAPVEYDDQGNPSHIILTKEFQDGISELKKVANARNAIAAENRESFGFDEKANAAYLQASLDLANKGVVTLPNGNQMTFDEFKTQWNNEDDYSRAGILQDWTGLLDNRQADGEARGFALAALQKLGEEKMTKGRLIDFGGRTDRLDQFFASATKSGIESMYNLADLLIPDSVARVSKFDESAYAKDYDRVMKRMSALEGYDTAIQSGAIASLAADIVISAAATGFTGGAAAPKLAAAGTRLANLGARTVNLGNKIRQADNALLTTALGKGLIAGGKLVDHSADLLKHSRTIRYGLADLAVGQPIFTSLTYNPKEDVGKQFQRDAIWSLGATGLFLGAGRVYKASKAAAVKASIEGMDVASNARVGNAIFDDIDDLSKAVAGPQRVGYSAVDGAVGGRTGDILDAADSMRAVKNVTDNATIQRFVIPDPEDNIRIFLDDTQPKVIKSIFQKHYGEVEGAKIAKQFREYMDGLRKLGNRAGLGIDYRKSYIPRTGVRGFEGQGGRATGLSTQTGAAQARKLETGRDVLAAEGYLPDVNLTNLVSNYARDITAKATNSVAVLNLIHSGDIIRQAVPDSAAFKAAMDNGGIVRLVRTLPDGQTMTAGFAATDRWLAQNGYSKIIAPELQGALRGIQKQSKNFRSGFYANNDTISKLENFAARNLDKGTDNALHSIANVSRRLQDVVLSGGVPYTALNIFSVSQMVGAMMADPLHFYKYIRYMGSTANDAAFRTYLAREFNRGIDEVGIASMARHGMDFFPEQSFGSPRGREVAVRTAGEGLEQVDTVAQLNRAITRQQNTVKRLTTAADAADEKLAKATEKLAKAELRTPRAAAAAESEGLSASTILYRGSGGTRPHISGETLGAGRYFAPDEATAKMFGDVNRSYLAQSIPEAQVLRINSADDLQKYIDDSMAWARQNNVSTVGGEFMRRYALDRGYKAVVSSGWDGVPSINILDDAIEAGATRPQSVVQTEIERIMNLPNRTVDDTIRAVSLAQQLPEEDAISMLRSLGIDSRNPKSVGDAFYKVEYNPTTRRIDTTLIDPKINPLEMTPEQIRDFIGTGTFKRSTKPVGQAAALRRAQTAVTKATQEADEARAALLKANTDLDGLRVRQTELEGAWSQENTGWQIANAVDAKGLKTALQDTGRAVAEQYDKAVTNVTFDRFIPTLQYETAKYIVERNLRMGLPEAEAYARAKQAMSRFWGMSSPNDISNFGRRIGMTLENRQIYDDMASTFFLAPKYRGAMIGRFFNTIKAMKNPLAPENKLLFNWAMSGLAMFGAWQAAQKSLTGRYTWENPTGAFDELQIPLGDGQIIRIPLWGTQLSIIRNIGRGFDALARGDGERFGQEVLATGSVLAQSPLRIAFNTQYTGKPVSEDPLLSVGGLAERFGFLISNYTGHPFIQAAKKFDDGNILQAVLTAIESPLRTGNPDRTAVGVFYNQTIPKVEAIVDKYGTQIRKAFDDEEKKSKLQAQMMAEVADVVRDWGQRFEQDIEALPQDMARAIIRAVVPPDDFSLGGLDTREGTEQVSVQASLKRGVRQEAREQGLNLYSPEDYFDDAKAGLQGAPENLAFEFKKIVQGDKKTGRPSLYEVKQDWQDQLTALFNRARGLSGSEATKAYKEISAFQEQYMREVFTPRIQPLIDKYGPTVLRNSKVFRELEQYVMVPGDFTPFHSTKKQPYLTANQFAYLMDTYGVGKLNNRNFATDEEVLTEIQKANSDINAGRLQAADYRLREVQRRASEGQTYVDEAAMNEIKRLIALANKRR